MNVAVIRDRGKPMQIMEAEIPENGDDEVLIKVSANGVCHTDLKLISGELPAELPTVAGHEISGIIESVGESCKMGFSRGDRVIVGLRYKCGSCVYCATGRENLCIARPKPPDLRAKDGGAIHRWNMGGLAEYLAVPEYVVSRLPDNLPLKESAILGCRVTTAYNAVVNGAVAGTGESTLVIGCGGVGLNIIKFLSLLNAYPIIAADIIKDRLAAAKRFGATHTIDAASADVVRSVKEITKVGVDKSFEAIGVGKTSDQAIQSVRPGGTAILAGSPRGPFTISDAGFAFREVKVTGVAMRRVRDVQKVLELASLGKIDPKDFVTESYPFPKVNDAYGDLEHGRIRIMGVVSMA